MPTVAPRNWFLPEKLVVTQLVSETELYITLWNFDVLTEVTVDITVIWDVTPCSLLDCYRLFGDR
jgi:hypothetical protein